MMREYNIMSGLAKYLINGVTTDGGWDAESGNNKETNPLNTSEVLCGLISARQRLCLNGLPSDYDSIINNAIGYLQKTQLPSGGWATGSTYRQGDKNTAKGNTVSTCFALWALILDHELVEKNSELVNIIKKSINFLIDCRNDNHLYSYSPGLSVPSSISTAYVLLSYSLILSWDTSFNQLGHETRLEVSNGINNILGTITEEEILNDITSRYISAILIYLAILILPETRDIPATQLKKVKGEFSRIVHGLTLDQCTQEYTEEQVIREDGKTARDFTHYIPVWMLILNSRLNDEERHLNFQILNCVLKNIHHDNDGVYLAGKRWTWATGLTLFSLSHYFSNLDVDMLIQREGIDMSDNKKVFVVHGRDLEFKDNVVRFLRALFLEPLEWEQVVQETCKPTPTTYEIISKGFELAQSIIILLSGDDEGKLKDEFVKVSDDSLEKTISPQPRLNVVFEAGLAFGMNQQRTIIIRKQGELRKISDVDGFNYVVYDSSPESRNAIAGRLQTAGCLVNKSGNDWLKA